MAPMRELRMILIKNLISAKSRVTLDGDIRHTSERNTIDQRTAVERDGLVCTQSHRSMAGNYCKFIRVRRVAPLYSRENLPNSSPSSSFFSCVHRRKEGRHPLKLRHSSPLAPPDPGATIRLRNLRLQFIARMDLLLAGRPYIHCASMRTRFQRAFPLNSLSSPEVVVVVIMPS